MSAKLPPPTGWPAISSGWVARRWAVSVDKRFLSIPGLYATPWGADGAVDPALGRESARGVRARFGVLRGAARGTERLDKSPGIEACAKRPAESREGGGSVQRLAHARGRREYQPRARARSASGQRLAERIEDR